VLRTPKAILFDLDGVLTHTGEYHFLAWKHLADDEGIPFTQEENDAHLLGIGRRESLLYIIRNRHYTEAQLQEMMDRKNRYYNDLLHQMTSEAVVEGGRTLLEEIRQAGIKTAVASASTHCRIVLESLCLSQYFDGIADGYSVSNRKPASDIFVYAAGLVNVPTSACLGVEDANSGIEAIKMAGMQALAIGPAVRFHRADKVLPTLANKRLHDVLA